MDNRDTYVSLILWFAYAQNFKLLTLGAHAPEGYSTVCIVAPRAIRCRNSSSSDFSAIRACNLKREFSLKRFVPKLWRNLLTSSIIIAPASFQGS